MPAKLKPATKSTKIVVKQDMIDFIKSQGMARSLKRAGEIKANNTKGETEFLEGVRRMYGQARLDKATKSFSKPRATSAESARATAIKKTIAKQKKTK